MVSSVIYNSQRRGTQIPTKKMVRFIWFNYSTTKRNEILSKATFWIEGIDHTGKPV